MAKFKSTSSDVSTPLTIDGLDSNFGYREISVTFYTDDTFSTVVDAGLTGTYALSATPFVNAYPQDVAGATAVDVSVASELKTPIRIDTGVTSITVAPTAIAGASHWELRTRAEDDR